MTNIECGQIALVKFGERIHPMLKLKRPTKHNRCETLHYLSIVGGYFANPQKDWDIVDVIDPKEIVWRNKQ